MFGRHGKRQIVENTEAAVDAHLEDDIAMVEEAVNAYLANPTNDVRKNLLATLTGLDEQTGLSDSYESGIVDSPIFGVSPRGSVIGETSANSLAEEIPALELRAQVALVRAAKDQIERPTPESLASLRAASSNLASIRQSDTDTPEMPGPSGGAR